MVLPQIFTTHNSSCMKVFFSTVSVILSWSMVRGAYPMGEVGDYLELCPGVEYPSGWVCWGWVSHRGDFVWGVSIPERVSMPMGGEYSTGEESEYVQVGGYPPPPQTWDLPGGLVLTPPLLTPPKHVRLVSGRYASYWNAFLVSLFLLFAHALTF